MRGLQIGSAGAIAGDVGAGYRTRLFGNAYYDGSAYKYIASAAAVMQVANGNNGTFEWHNAGSGTAGNAITFTQAMTLTASGRLGIGTTSPSDKLDVRGGRSYLESTSGDQYILKLTNPANADGVFLGSPATDSLAVYSASGTERARIDSSGNLLVGTTSATAKVAVNNGSVVQFTGAWENNNAGTQYFHSFAYNGGQIGQITGNNTGTTYATSSDYRLKENVQPMQDALAVIAQLNPVTYTWKADGSDGQGFIAHELQAVVPDCVTGEKDAVDAEGNPQYQGVDTSFLVATLVKAVQELKAEVDSLKAQLEAN
jgi:hypothetical protein